VVEPIPFFRILADYEWASCWPPPLPPSVVLAPPPNIQSFRFFTSPGRLLSFRDSPVLPDFTPVNQLLLGRFSIRPPLVSLYEANLFTVEPKPTRLFVPVFPPFSMCSPPLPRLLNLKIYRIRTRYGVYYPFHPPLPGSLRNTAFSGKLFSFIPFAFCFFSPK